MSQHDRYFCLFILNFIKTKASPSDFIDILKEFLVNERLQRDKMVLDDYILLIAKKSLEYAQQNDLLG